MTQPQGSTGPLQRNFVVEVDIWTSQGASLLAQNVQMAAQIEVLTRLLSEALASATPPPEGPPPGD